MTAEQLLNQLESTRWLMNPEYRDLALAIVNRAFAEQRHHTRCPLYWWAHSAIAGMWADSLAQIATLTVAPPATPR